MMKGRDEQLLIDFGFRVRALRVARGWSQTELDAESGIDRVQIERIENARINTSIGVADQLAKAFEKTLSELFDFKN